MSHVFRTAAAVMIGLALGAGRVSAAQAQAPASAPDQSFVVAGDVTQALTVTTTDLKAMPRTTVTVTEEGRDIRYEGVLVGELLKRAGAPVGRDLSGKAVATYVRASAKDGYHVVFSLAELDPGFTANDIIVADTIDGKPLFDYQGPFRIVAPHDKRGARSIRMLQRIEVVRLVK
jgi:DMSO/TMAO reductase YedYZ molybdopterin-dependent catalytic subunit